MTDPTPAGSPGSIIESLGQLREQRVAETIKSFPLPDTQERLWATYRLPEGERVTQVSAMLSSGHKGGVSAATNLLSDSLTELFLADGVEDDELTPVGRQEFPGCDDFPMGLDDRLDRFPELCPPRPGSKPHTTATRIRALIGSDAMVAAHAMAICGWSLGGANNKGAAREVSEAFVGE